MSEVAWSFGAAAPVRALALATEDARTHAWGGSTGAGVKVAVVDSGIDADHPRVGGVDGWVAMEVDLDEPDGVRRVPGPHEDLVGHGTACAGIIRSIAPEVSLHSVRVLGPNLKGRGAMLVAGIAWAVEHGMDVVNLSLSSRSPAWQAPLHEVADLAHHAGVVLVCAANNVPGPTYPAEFASVVSVASRRDHDPWGLTANPCPPVDFAAHGTDVDVAWADGGSIVATGNSFAAPHVAGMAALVRARHPGLNAYQVKALLHAACDNARP
ncbi:S8 family serine peptidase [Nocardioides sp. SOB77]|uniref:S8 family serine peptidase n=1 Tax=Nocardioides oceani TaxID=3058369 RepID=A0ABT8FLW9_9ACTN|nr:S8 family serine peptidase [Nocardioides oceani]MDN4175382.1 S8 family serine peptidase [Nocardioides oceani]